MLAGSKRIIDMQIHSVGIDLGKTTFHLVALGAAGKVLLPPFPPSLSPGPSPTASALISGRLRDDL